VGKWGGIDSVDITLNVDMWAQAPAHHAHESNEMEVQVQYARVALQAGGQYHQYVYLVELEHY